ncbi:MAG: YicC/YloC family endoribonuclease [Pseudomonadota bacterium]
MTQSMTGFASHAGGAQTHTWRWDIRGVNAKGLDLRMRVPDWIEGLEADLRTLCQKHIARGSISIACKIAADDSVADTAIDPRGLANALTAIAQVTAIAEDQKLPLGATSAKDILDMQGVLVANSEAKDGIALKTPLLRSFEAALGEFVEMRRQEGTQLERIIDDQVASIEGLIGSIEDLLDKRRADMDARFAKALERLVETVEPERVATELALIAVKADVTEEVDRLKAHIVATRDLLRAEGPKGRKLDFLSQEFNREANTLCSKSQHAELTAFGLELKTVIDQMREQIQNVE